MIFRLFTLFFCSLLFCNISAQRLDASDKSESSVRKYRSIINKNKQLVSFIEYSFTQRGVPKHMKNLAIIESHLDQRQVSSAGAAGVWQFMTGHANDLGLSEADRSDMYKSTKAATSSLIRLYNKYQNWVTVVAAYNCGEGNISKAMQRAGSKNYTVFKSFLPAETQNHVQKYLNASYATGELDEVLQDFYKTIPTTKIKSDQPEIDYKTFTENTLKNQDKLNLREMPINAGYNLSVILKYLQIDKNEFLKWNLALEKNLNETGEGILILPLELMDVFTINKYKILQESLNN